MMAIHIMQRKCGWPRQGGYYVLSYAKPATCFALPATLCACTECEQSPKFSRAPKQISRAYLMRIFNCLNGSECKQKCLPKHRKYWLTFVGSDYTEEEFVTELRAQGLSRRIPRQFARLIDVDDIFVCVKNNKIIALIPVQAIAYYPKETDDQRFLEDLQAQGIEIVYFVRHEFVQKELFD